ncbi:MAG TPA: hypothetical protein VH591_05645 [Ktedonobacterales bacterium]
MQQESLAAAADTESALKSLIGQVVQVLTTYMDGHLTTPSSYVGNLVGVFSDAIVMLIEHPPQNERREVLIYKHSIVAVMVT